MDMFIAANYTHRFCCRNVTLLTIFILNNIHLLCALASHYRVLLEVDSTIAYLELLCCDMWDLIGYNE